MIDDSDIIELASVASGHGDFEEEDNIDEILQNKYGVEFDTYALIVEDLLPLTPIIETSIRKTRVHAFLNKNSVILIKSPAL